MSGGVMTIVKRELAGYFVSPVAYVFLVIFLRTVAAPVTAPVESE